MRKGFTLIEVLLVMAILSVLLGFATVKLQLFQRKQEAYDIMRKADARAIQQGVSGYVIDNMAIPPGTPTGNESVARDICRENVIGSACTGAPVNGVDLSVLLPNYLKTIPVDPASTSSIVTGYKLYSDGEDVFAVATLLGTNPASSSSSSSSSQPTSTLVAHWKFDDGNGTIAADFSGNGRTGTLVNGPTWTTGLFTGGLQFDGANDEVTVADHASLDGFSAFTLSVWMSPYSWRDAGIVGMQGAYELRLRSDGRINFSVTRQSSTARAVSNSVAPIGHWTHITLSYDDSSVRLYINGVLDNSVNAAGTVAIVSAPLRIGGGTYFHGKIDDVRLQSAALTATEIGALGFAGFPNSQMAYWSYDDGAGTTASDGSGNGRTGNLVNGPVWTSTSTAPTNFSNSHSLTFDGSNDYVRVPYAAGMDFRNSNGFSAATWAYLTTSMQQGGLVGMLSNNSQGWLLYVQRNYAYFYMNNGNYVSVGIPSTGWHHIAGIWDGRQMRIYVDGNLRNNTAYGSSPANVQNALIIGGFYSSGYDHGGTPEYRFSGKLDETKLFNRPLSAAEVSALAAGGVLP